MRTPTRRRAAFVATLTALALTAAACGDDDNGSSSDTTEASENGGGGGSVSGQVNLDGSSTVGPLAEVAAELFMDENPDVRVTVAISGTGGGFEKFCIGETDGNNASREIKDEEIAQCDENGIAYDNITVANDALSVVVNQDNPIDCLTVDQISQIWDEGSTVSTWGDVEGIDAGDFASTSMTLYGPGSDSGTFDFFTDEINGEEGKIRTDYTDIGEDDAAAVVGVSGEAGAMGYIPYSYFQEAQDEVKALQIDDGNGCVDGTLENVQAGEYTPLGRPLFIYASDTALARPEVVAFMEFTIENAEEIAEIGGYVPLTDEQKEEQLAKVQALAGS
ncbi:PstS family phosphate ABC transporter substrate-binding protein [Rhabdothermincola salaria]|uniref:PstS family phosphate ABC transporter substrate-binding protein n=1 Tax=Rhabdothermincola salaria TaxID=2903142 RepID=UPI001E4CCAEF|nr:PstS family phosphate ABC transporter substrate-binding protein [Rhabdothermincola salaria]MCD9625589.1 PstS family phosphate ABC transporter substrate-binding protein [Rhabdothermincola salaria]